MKGFDREQFEKFVGKIVSLRRLENIQKNLQARSWREGFPMEIVKAENFLEQKLRKIRSC